MDRSPQPGRPSGRLGQTTYPLLLLWALAAPLAAAPDPTYAALRAAKPDGRRVPVSGLVLERDVFRFQLDSGAFHFLAPVEGRTPGAVFVGQGSYRLVPATETERQHLALVSGGEKTFEVLSDSFEELVLLFSDGTAAEIERHAAVQPGTPDPRAEAAWERHMKRQRKDFRTNFHLRLLADLLHGPAPEGQGAAGAFLAFVDGSKLPPALAAVDPEGAEALQPGSGLGGEESLLLVSDPKRGGAWYLSDRRDEIVSGKPSPPRPRTVDALDYRIDTRVGSDDDLQGTTYVRFSVLRSGLRVLPVYLLPRLRLQSAALAGNLGTTAAAGGGGEQQWTELPFVQEDREEDGDAAVIFPRPLDKGRTLELRFTYAGDEVLHDVGEHNYVVGARESWYPNLGVFSDPATFELTYRVPKGSEVISVGRLVDSRVEGDRAVSIWVCDQPVQVAGFNYGRFRKIEKKEPETGVEVVVYTGVGTPDVIRAMNQFLATSRASAAVDFGDDEEGGDLDFEGGAPGVEVGDLNTDKLAQSALVDGLNSARIFTTYFGPLPEKRVAITQQSEWSYGQSWPSLIFLPYMAFLTGSQRARLGLNQAVDFVNEVGYHEFSHQWWGHLVGWDSYRDQWLSEGFAEFSAALALQQVRGFPAYAAFWRDNRESILKKSPGDDLPPNQAGPVSLGYRLATHRTPSAGQLIYSKGGYALHMLRMMMWDHTSANPDAKFIAMMRDFVAANAGKHASAADFKKAIERHMLPQLDATGDGKMDWFFRQWIDGTEIPRYTSKLKVEKQGDAYKISGQVTQEGVSKDFYAYVPVYLDFGKGELARIGAIRMVGSASVPVDASLRLPKKPRKALINAAGDVLARE